MTNSIRPDTVGEPKSAEVCLSHMPSLKAKKLGKLPQEKVLLELGSRLGNSIGSIDETCVYGILFLRLRLERFNIFDERS